MRYFIVVFDLDDNVHFILTCNKIKRAAPHKDPISKLLYINDIYIDGEYKVVFAGPEFDRKAFHKQVEFSSFSSKNVFDTEKTKSKKLRRLIKIIFEI